MRPTLRVALAAALVVASHPAPGRAGGAPSTPAAAPRCTEPIRLGYNDLSFPPQINGNGPAFDERDPGWNVVAAREAARRVGCPVTEVRVPSRRLVAMLADGDLDFAFFYAPTPSRMKTMRFPLDAHGRPDPAYSTVAGRLVLVALKGAGARVGWDGHALAPGVRIGAVTGTVQDAVARSNGWPVEPISTTDQALPMLRGHRFDALLAPRPYDGGSIAPGTDADDLMELAPAVTRVQYYAPTSLQTWARRPEVVRRYWHELCVSSRRFAPQGVPPCGP